MRIERLYRYPVKGLNAEALDGADVQPGGALPWDRAFALAHGDAPFDPATATAALQSGPPQLEVPPAAASAARSAAAWTR